MSRIIYCSDIILRVEDQHEEIANISRWIAESTDYKPLRPESCVMHYEVGTGGKLTVILAAWLALVTLTVFYCYFCERRFFPRQRRLMDFSSKGGPSGIFCRRRRGHGQPLDNRDDDDWSQSSW
jgi:hypothetical protein